jgi:hypothetical protein
VSDGGLIDRIGERLTRRLASGTTRRSLLATVGAGLLGLGAAERTASAPPGTVPGTEHVGRWFGFCGHYWTTGSCPTPHHLPRVDFAGLPVRPGDGRPVDNIGRLIDGAGLPVDEDGRPLTDPDGRRLPPAPRTRICEDWVGDALATDAVTQGAWYRCCDDQIRKLTDCCIRQRRRINGDDGALQGYCARGRYVYCVVYVDTGVPC